MNECKKCLKFAEFFKRIHNVFIDFREQNPDNTQIKARYLLSCLGKKDYNYFYDVLPKLIEHKLLMRVVYHPKHIFYILNESFNDFDSIIYDVHETFHKSKKNFQKVKCNFCNSETIAIYDTGKNLCDVCSRLTHGSSISYMNQLQEIKKNKKLLA